MKESEMIKELKKEIDGIVWIGDIYIDNIPIKKYLKRQISDHEKVLKILKNTRRPYPKGKGKRTG